MLYHRMALSCENHHDHMSGQQAPPGRDICGFPECTRGHLRFQLTTTENPDPCEKQRARGKTSLAPPSDTNISIVVLLFVAVVSKRTLPHIAHLHITVELQEHDSEALVGSDDLWLQLHGVSQQLYGRVDIS